METIELGPCPKCGGPAQKIADDSGVIYRHVDLRSASGAAGVMRRFTWRDKPPAEPGYYWYANPRHAKTMLCIFEHKDDLYVETSDGVISHPGAYDGEWAGPIPDPIDEAESAA